MKRWSYTTFADDTPCSFCCDSNDVHYKVTTVITDMDGYSNKRGACVYHLDELYASEVTLRDYRAGRYDASEA